MQPGPRPSNALAAALMWDRLEPVLPVHLRASPDPLPDEAVFTLACRVRQSSCSAYTIGKGIGRHELVITADLARPPPSAYTSYWGVPHRNTSKGSIPAR